MLALCFHGKCPTNMRENGRILETADLEATDMAWLGSLARQPARAPAEFRSGIEAEVVFPNLLYHITDKKGSLFVAKRSIITPASARQLHRRDVWASLQPSSQTRCILYVYIDIFVFLTPLPHFIFFLSFLARSQMLEF